MTQPIPPTQVKKPWQAVKRTALAVLGFVVTFAPLWPEIVTALGGILPTVWLTGGATTAALFITRILAIPGVNAWLRKRLPTLSAEGKQK